MKAEDDYQILGWGVTIDTRAMIMVLGSGSSGNCIVVRYGGHAIMVDAGIPPKLVRERASSLGFPLTSLDAVLLTHWHLDHAKFATEIATSYACPLYCSTPTMQALEPKPPRLRHADFFPVEIDDSPFEFFPLRVIHEDGSRVFVIQAGPKTIVVAHDLQQPNDALLSACKGADALLIEANHDTAMLAACTNQERRNGGAKHLNNDQAAEIVAACDRNTLQLVCALHISQVCNVASLVESTLRSALQGYHARLVISSQDEPLLLEVNGRPEGVDELGTDAQAARTIDRQVKKIVAAQVSSNLESRKRMVELSGLFARMHEIFEDCDDPKKLGLLDREGEVCCCWEQWKKSQAVDLEISLRTANYDLSVGKYLLPLVEAEELEQIPVVATRALGLYAKTKGEVPDELIEFAKANPGPATKSEVFRRLFHGQGHHEGADTQYICEAREKQVEAIGQHLAAIKSLDEPPSRDDAEIIELALVSFLQELQTEQEERQHHSRERFGLEERKSLRRGEGEHGQAADTSSEVEQESRAR